jgi:hypothetical protein
MGHHDNPNYQHRGRTYTNISNTRMQERFPVHAVGCVAIGPVPEFCLRSNFLYQKKHLENPCPVSQPNQGLLEISISLI